MGHFSEVERLARSWVSAKNTDDDRGINNPTRVVDLLLGGI
jgi:hypothetical protein